MASLVVVTIAVTGWTLGTVLPPQQPSPPPKTAPTHADRLQLAQTETAQRGGNSALSYAAGDPYVEDFLRLSIQCGPGEATIFDFLSVRSLPYRPKLNLYYAVDVGRHDGERVINLRQRTTGQGGRPLPNVPAEARYSYLVTDGQPRLVDYSTNAHFPDPLAFMRQHRDAVCNAMVRYQLLRLPSRSDANPEQMNFHAKADRIHFLLTLPADNQRRADAPVAPDDLSPDEPEVDAAHYFAAQDGAGLSEPSAEGTSAEDATLSEAPTGQGVPEL